MINNNKHKRTYGDQAEPLGLLERRALQAQKACRCHTFSTERKIAKQLEKCERQLESKLD